MSQEKFLNPSRTTTESIARNAQTVPPLLDLPFKQKVSHLVTSLSFDEEHISSVDTLQLPVVPSPNSLQQHPDFFANALVDDIACQATLRLPVLRFTKEHEAQSNQLEVITSTAGGAAIAGIGDFTFAILKYLTNVVMTNIVSESIYGTYMAVYTSALIIGSIAELGLDSTMIRFFSNYRIKGQSSLAAGLIRFVLGTALISSLICCALFFLFANVLARLIYHQDGYTLPLKEIALLIPLVALQLVLGSALQSLKAIKLKVFVDRLIHPTVTLVLVVVFYFLGLRLEALILATICGFLASVITGQILLRAVSRPVVSDAAPKYEIKTWLGFALPMSFYTFIQNVMNSTDILFLTAFTTAAQVGLYAAADRTSTFVVMPILALNTIFSPQIAEYCARGEYDQLISLTRLVTKWSFSVSLPICLCFCIFHEQILSIFSKGYTAASTTLIILSFSNLFTAVAGSTGSLMVMTGHARLVLANTAVTITVNLGLAFLLVPRFSIVGAAITALLAVVILDVAYFIEVYQIFQMTTFRRDMFKPIIAGLVASVVGFLMQRVIHVGYGYRAIPGSLSLIFPFLLVYVLILALLRFSKEDRIVLDAVLTRIGGKAKLSKGM